MAASMIDHTADRAPDEENDNNTPKADRSNSSDSDSDYTPNEYSSDSEDSVNLTCIFLFFKGFLGLISQSNLIWVNTIFILRSA